MSRVELKNPTSVDSIGDEVKAIFDTFLVWDELAKSGNTKKSCKYAFNFVNGCPACHFVAERYRDKSFELHDADFIYYGVNFASIGMNVEMCLHCPCLKVWDQPLIVNMCPCESERISENDEAVYSPYLKWKMAPYEMENSTEEDTMELRRGYAREIADGCAKLIKDMIGMDVYEEGQCSV